MDLSRIADLKRRLQADPTSIAFAQLAEEYRRAGQLDEAVGVCREGLRRHPGYLSARITLGRALAEQGDAAGAEQEFEEVLRTAPDNLAAVRGLAELAHTHGDLERALTLYQRAGALTRYDPDLDEVVKAIADELARLTPGPASGLSFEQARQELIDASRRMPGAPSAGRVDFDALLRSLGHEPDAPAPPIVEALLSDAARAAGLMSEATTESASPVRPASDLLARLEADLRQMERRPPPAISQTREGTGRDAAAATMAALERWLSAIAVRRRALAVRR